MKQKPSERIYEKVKESQVESSTEWKYIVAILEFLDEAQEQKVDIKLSTPCKKCGGRIPDGAIFCIYCKKTDPHVY